MHTFLLLLYPSSCENEEVRSLENRSIYPSIFKVIFWDKGINLKAKRGIAIYHVDTTLYTEED